MALEDIDTTPPKQSQQNARRGLELRKVWGRGGTEVGVARARNISNGDSLSEDTIKRMASFNRHRQNYNPDKKENDGGPTAGTILNHIEDILEMVIFVLVTVYASFCMATLGRYRGHRLGHQKIKRV